MKKTTQDAAGASPSQLIADETRGAAADRKELERIAATLIAVVTEGKARALALDIVEVLLAIFMQRSFGTLYDLALADIDLILHDAATATEWPEDARLRAELLSARLFSRGVGKTWAPEHRIPFEIANALRRACEVGSSSLLPLIVRDARAMCVEAKVDGSRIEAAIAKHGGTPS
mgnify:CR=1 FL=1